MKQVTAKLKLVGDNSTIESNLLNIPNFFFNTVYSKVDLWQEWFEREVRCICNAGNPHGHSQPIAFIWPDKYPHASLPHLNPFFFFWCKNLFVHCSDPAPEISFSL